jgi:cbb3-type cytochrome oxidase subunit 3
MGGGRVNASDWISNAIALTALLSTIALTFRANRKNAAAEAKQIALADAQQDTNSKLARIVSELADDDVQSPDDGTSKAAAQPDWVSESHREDFWLIRNVGLGVAYSVAIDVAAIKGMEVEVEPTLPTDVRPGESIKLTATRTWEADGTPTAWISWDGGSVEVPLWQWY